jgi:hypothetical protein
MIPVIPVVPVFPVNYSYIMQMKDPLEVYKEAIMAKYEVEKNGDFATFLSQPTPALIRNYCLRLYDNGLSANDLNIFRIFFNVKEGDNLRRAIENYGTGKLKSVISVLKDEKMAQHQFRLELAAILVDFTPRPFQNFVKNDGVHFESGKTSFETVRQAETASNPAVTNTPAKSRSANGKKIIIAVGLLLLVCMLIVGFKSIYFPAKNCMIWTGFEYKAISCEDKPTGLMIHTERVVPRDEELLLYMKKIDPNAKTVFFKNQKPIVWYSKYDGKCEYFTWPGLHPVTGKTLKPITRTIIDNHILK